MKKVLFLSTVVAALFATEYMPGIPGNVPDKTVSVGVEKVKIIDSGLKSATALTVKCEKQNGRFLSLKESVGAETAYGKMDYEDSNGNLSYLRFATFIKLTKDFKLPTGEAGIFGGLKAKTLFVGGLNHVGIGASAIGGAEYRLGNFGLSLYGEVGKDYLRGGYFKTETGLGADVSYSF